MLAAAPAAGYLLPDYWLARTARLRADAALRELPNMLDLLRVTVQAGRAPLAAMGLVAQRFDGPLAAEWRAAAAQTALGVPQEAALAQVARRLPVAGVRTFVETLSYSNRAGLSLTDALAAQAAAARHARRRQIREHAARAGPEDAAGRRAGAGAVGDAHGRRGAGCGVHGNRSRLRLLGSPNSAAAAW